MENVTRLGDRYRELQQSLNQLFTQSDVLENIWKLQNLLQNHSHTLAQLGLAVQELEQQVQTLRYRSDETSSSMAVLSDRVGTLSFSSLGNWSSLQADLTQTAGSLRFQDTLLQDTAGQVVLLKDKLNDVTWTVGHFNRTFMNDISIHRLNIQDLQGLVGNVTEETRTMRVTQISMEDQLKNEIKILSTITEDLRLKDWEKSAALKNLTLIEGNPCLTGLQLQGSNTHFQTN